MIKDICGLIEKTNLLIRAETDEAVVGLSGGADSTLVACLCVKALGADKVHGVSMPFNQLDKDTFNTSSKKLADKLGIRHSVVDIGSAVEALSSQFGGLDRLSTINGGNMRSRMRMVSLYTSARVLNDAIPENRVRVVGTGNLSEDFIGYDTKGGDALCDFFPIGSLLKSEVYQLLEHFASEGLIDDDMINRTPSAGLWDGQTDEDELGLTYAEMEEAVITGFEHGADSLDLNNPVEKLVHDMHYANKHKHEAPPAFNLREFCE